jgi:methylmalonyl-CoA/ethylmalonyl-CoA epimerase
MSGSKVSERSVRGSVAAPEWRRASGEQIRNIEEVFQCPSRYGEGMKNDPANAELGAIGQIGLTVEDLEKATVFYRDILRLKHLFDAPPAMAFFACGNVRLMLSRPERPGAERFAAAIYFKVDDIQGARDTLVKRGVTFEAEPKLLAKMPDHELWMAFFRDPDRNLLALMCEKRS